MRHPCREQVFVVRLTSSPRVGSDDEHVAAAAETKARLVHEVNAEIQRSVIDDVSDEIHDLAVSSGYRSRSFS
jgi:hypothetical protein